MPSSDLILNVKQIAGYTTSGPLPNDLVVIQRGGLGGPYMSMTVEDLVATSLAYDEGPPMGVGVQPPANAAPSTLFTGGIATIFDGQWLWNGYIDQNIQGRYLGNGPAGLFIMDRVAGWSFAYAPPGAAGALLTPLNTQLTISPSGYVTVSEQVKLARDPAAPMEAATAQWVQATINNSVALLQSLYSTATVWSFNCRTGNIILNVNDIMGAGGAPIFSPVFQGQPTAPSPPAAASDGEIVTAAWVIQHVGNGAVQSFNGRTGAVTLTPADITGANGLANPSPALTGVPTAPTPLATNNSTAIATTAFVANAITNQDLSNYAPLNSPQFTGSPTAPTVPPGASDGRLATTAFVHAAVVASTTGVSSFNTRTGAVTLTTADISGAGGALIASPTFTGVPAAPTAAPGTNTTQIATTAYVLAALAGGGAVTSFNTRTGAVVLTQADVTGAGGAPTVSPALTGTPTAPTATAGTATTQIATTAFVANAITSLGTVVSSFNGRSGAVTLAANDISAAGGAVLASPAFSGVPTAPTATAGTNTSQIATTSFVAAAIAAGQGVSSFNGRTGAITLTATDVTGAGGAPLASPTFTGTPSGPTATAGTSNTQLATTAFVAAAITAGSVVSFNGRTGTVTLQASDITGAGGAVLASPAFTGAPTAPTAATATNTTQIATTAFVQNAINAIGAGVVSFNGRTGAVSLIQNDISAAGGAVLASPAFTGTPTAPTASPGTSTTQLATTAFVGAALGSYLPLSGGALTGPLTSSVNIVTGAPMLALGKTNPGAANAIGGYTGTPSGANERWQINLGDGSAESGSNAGSNFSIVGFSDTGAALGNALMFTRSSLAASFVGNVNAPGANVTNNIQAGGGVYAGTVFANYPTSSNFYLGSAGPNPILSWSSNWYDIWNVNGGARQWYCFPGSPIVGMSLDGAGNFVAAGTITQGSDARGKKDVEDAALGLEAVLAMRPKHYRRNLHPDWRARGRDRLEFGFVAQDMREALPEAVVEDEDGGLGVQLMPLIAALANAVKTLAERIEKLEARS